MLDALSKDHPEFAPPRRLQYGAVSTFRRVAFRASGRSVWQAIRWLANAHPAAFQIEEATIENIQSAILRKEVTSTLGLHFVRRRMI